MGDSIGVVVHYTNEETKHTPGGVSKQKYCLKFAAIGKHDCALQDILDPLKFPRGEGLSILKRSLYLAENCIQQVKASFTHH